MHTRTLAALIATTAIGVFALVPAFAQNAMPASAGTAMSHDAIHKDGMGMKTRSMQGDNGMMKADNTMKMNKDDGMMEKDSMKGATHDTMKMKTDSGVTEDGSGEHSGG